MSYGKQSYELVDCCFSGRGIDVLYILYLFIFDLERMLCFN